MFSFENERESREKEAGHVMRWSLFIADELQDLWNKNGNQCVESDNNSRERTTSVFHGNTGPLYEQTDELTGRLIKQPIELSCDLKKKPIHHQKERGKR